MRDGCERETALPGLERLRSVVNQRADHHLRRAFFVTQISVLPARTRTMTTQRIFLLGKR